MLLFVCLIIGRRTLITHASILGDGYIDTFQPSKMAIREVPMSSKRYLEKFKIEAVRQVTDRGHSVAQVANCKHPSNATTLTFLSNRLHCSIFSTVSLTPMRPGQVYDLP